MSPIRIDAASDVISRPWSRDSSALEFILSRSRSRSRDLKKGLDNNTGYIVCLTYPVFNVMVLSDGSVGR